MEEYEYVEFLPHHQYVGDRPRFYIVSVANASSDLFSQEPLIRTCHTQPFSLSAIIIILFFIDDDDGDDGEDNPISLW